MSHEAGTCRVGQEEDTQASAGASGVGAPADAVQDDAQSVHQNQQQQHGAAPSPQGSESQAHGVVPQAFVDDGASPHRPTDEAILLQQNEIRDAEARKIDYVGPREPLQDLKQEYLNGNEVFALKIDRLAADYDSFRRTRGDGNCFFRAVVFSCLEHLLATADKAECDRLAACVRDWREKLVAMGYQELVFEDAMDILLEQLTAIAKPLHERLPLEGLEINFRDDTVSNMVVMFLRLVTSCEVQRREDFFAPFIMGMYDDPPATVELFCQRLVEPMGEESDHIHIVALTDALKLPVRVVYLDSSNPLAGGGGGGGGLEPTSYDFVPDSLPAGSQPRVHLLYRPGHYDILYARTPEAV